MDNEYNPRESSQNIDLLQEKYQSKGLLFRFANQRFFKTIRDMLGDLNLATTLDAGCGEGVVLEKISLTQDKLAIGLDLDRSRLELAKETHLSVSFIQGNLHNLPFRDECFDTILALEVLEHVGDPERALMELHRIAKTYLLVSVPNEPWWRIGNMARLKYLSEWGNTPEHINHWTYWGFKKFISRYFEIIETRTPVLWTFILAKKKSRQ
jgi:ubiquinone/menaquinone biosynthesis C-methylase UbiE